MADLQFGKYTTLQEAASTAEFPVLLRDGLRAILFSEYGDTPTTYQEWCRSEPSDREQETWVEMANIGLLPRVNEGQQYPRLSLAQRAARQIRNFKYGSTLEITREMIRFDRTGLMKQWAAELGRAAAQTNESNAYTVALTSGNYVKTSAHNDIGNNTGATAFSAAGLVTAYKTLVTMKEERSGRYIGVMPDTLILGPALEFAARQLLASPVVTIPGATGVYLYGQGTTNPFTGFIKRIIVSPWVGNLGGQYYWILMQAKRPIIFQTVDPLRVLVADVQSADNEGFFEYDVIRYRVDMMNGVGMFDDRYAYLSTDTTGPAIA